MPRPPQGTRLTNQLHEGAALGLVLGAHLLSLHLDGPLVLSPLDVQHLHDLVPKENILKHK